MMDDKIINPPRYPSSIREDISFHDFNPEIIDEHYLDYLKLVNVHSFLSEEECRTLYRELRVENPIPKWISIILTTGASGGNKIDMKIEHRWILLEKHTVHQYLHDKYILENPNMALFLLNNLRPEVLRISMNESIWSVMKNRRERFPFEPIHFYLHEAHVNELFLNLKLMGYLTDSVEIVKHVGKIDKLYIRLETKTLSPLQIEEQTIKTLLPVLLSKGVKHCTVEIIIWRPRTSNTLVGDEYEFVLLDR